VIWPLKQLRSAEPIYFLASMAGGNTNQNPEAGIDTSVRPATPLAPAKAGRKPSNAEAIDTAQHPVH
jgi:hypothetical protein